MSQASQAIFQEISQLLTQRRTVEAREQLERMLALDPEDPEARSQAGDVYAYTGAHSTAYKHYNHAAETYNRLGRADMALAVHHKILELDPASLDSATQTRLRLLGLLVAAEDAIVAGAYDKAIAAYHEAVRQFPNHTISYQRLASLLVRLNRVDDAADQYLIVARAFYAHGVRTKARPYFERVLELKPAQGESLDALLACLKTEGKESEGQRFVLAAVQAQLQAGEARQAETAAGFLGPDFGAQASPLAAAVLLQCGHVARAEAMASDLDLWSPDVQGLFRGLGRSALERGDSVSADAYFRWAQGQGAKAPLAGAKLPDLPPGSGSGPAGTGASAEVPGSASAPQKDRVALQAVGEVCLAEGLYEEAVELFERLAKNEPNDETLKVLLRRAKAGLTPPPLSPPAPLPLVLPPLPQTAAPKADQRPVAPPAAPAESVSLPLFAPQAPPPPAAAPALPTAPAKPAVVAAQPPAQRPFVSAATALPIVRTSYLLQLGELPPAVAGAQGDADELIE